MLAGERIARFWATLPATDPDIPNMLRYCLAAAATQPAFYEAVIRIASAQGQRGEPLPDDLRSRIVGMLEGETPRLPRGRPKKRERDVRIFAALFVLQHLGLSPTLDEGRDRRFSGCGIVGGVLDLKYNAIASVFGNRRRDLRAHGLLPQRG